MNPVIILAIPVAALFSFLLGILVGSSRVSQKEALQLAGTRNEPPHKGACSFDRKSAAWRCDDYCPWNAFMQKKAAHLLETASWYTQDNGKSTEFRIRNGKKGWSVLLVNDPEEKDAILAALEAGETDFAIRMHEDKRRTKALPSA